MKPETSSAYHDAFLLQRGNLVEDLAARVQELKRVHWRRAFPVDGMPKDKPWNLIWVRWLLLFALVPGLLGLFSDSFGGISETQVKLGIAASRSCGPSVYDS